MTTKLPLSVVILSFNDETLIRPALLSVADWVDEVFVVDSGSTDRTVDIARQFTEKIVVHPFENYAAQRNWAQQALPITHYWVFHIDADERVTPELRAALEQFFASDQAYVAGILVARRTVFMGRWIRHGGHYPVYHMRIFRRHKGYCEDRLYDQHFVVDGPVIKVKGDLIDTIGVNLDGWMNRHLRWANLEMQQQLAAQRDDTDAQVLPSLNGSPIQKRRWLRANLYNRQRLFWRVFAYFGYRYIIRLGFLDGTQGLIFHWLQGFWFRFYIDAKIWEATRSNGSKAN
jgi:glycosyltransferase involved in cell wall biosynthesis